MKQDLYTCTCSSKECQAERGCARTIMLADLVRGNQKKGREQIVRLFGSEEVFAHQFALKACERFISVNSDGSPSGSVLDRFTELMRVTQSLIEEHGILTPFPAGFCTCGNAKHDSLIECKFDCLRKLFDLWCVMHQWAWYLGRGQQEYGKDWPTQEEVEFVKKQFAQV